MGELLGILGAGSLGRLWAACLPADRCAFVPRALAIPGPDLVWQHQEVAGSCREVSRPWLHDLSRTRLLLVTTKAGDTLSALKPAMALLPETCPVVLFQNGLGSQQAVAGHWPNLPILAATTTEAAHRPTPDKVIHAARGQTWVGPLTEIARAAAPPVVAQLASSGLMVTEEPDIRHRLWAKLVVNAGINPFTALLDCPNGQILDTPLFRNNIDGLCTELAALMAAEGLHPEPASELKARIEQVAIATASNTSSMRGDVLNRRPTEIDFINGYVARRSRELGLHAPVNQKLTEQVKQRVPHPTD